MHQLLQPGQTLTLTGGQTCHIDSYLGGGGQGEVYKATLGGNPVALKWYLPRTATPEQRTALQALIQCGPPNGRFLWPFVLAEAQGNAGFGYAMPLREARFHGLIDLIMRRVTPSFRVLVTVGMQLADSFLQLHAKGLCYRDISFGNVFFDPQNGDILICDNDNVAVNGQSDGGVLGTPRFMAPEIVRGEAKPDTSTDLFSLAVLLSYLLLGHHPLEGKKEAQIRCLDLPAMNKLYGSEPLFIFDPSDDSNRPLPGYHDNALTFWPLYPQFLRDLFTKAFTTGLHDPQHGRVRESEWRQALAQLCDSLIYCGHCGEENFYDVQALQTGGSLKPCWSCKKTPVAPPRIRIERQVVMLNHDTRLYPHHLDPQRTYDFESHWAEITRHPQNPNIWGLENLSGSKWVATMADGSVKDIEPGRTVMLAGGIKVNFGKVVGEIRV